MKKDPISVVHVNSTIQTVRTFDKGPRQFPIQSAQILALGYNNA